MQSLLVTGASRGIGLGLVRYSLESTPYFVIATCRRPSEASDLQKLTQQYGTERLLLLQLDTTSAASHAACQVTLAEKGVTQIDALIANAGVASSRNDDSFMGCGEADMMDVFNTNVVGTMQTMQSCNALVTSSAAKLCVVMSSKLGCISTAGGSYTSYRASKAAVNMLAMSYANEQTFRAAGGKVLCVHPGAAPIPPFLPNLTSAPLSCLLSSLPSLPSLLLPIVLRPVGWVQTDMGQSGGRRAPVSVQDSAKGIMQLVQAACCVQTGSPIPVPIPDHAPLDSFVKALRDQSCVFVAYDGELLPW
mmetsp:Transcript_4022/g.8792  ORF Transcript_4022/g.8792 Transcript_4022/m.8792 type:complete len:306 (-) Transcript_4022:140-1057(-)